jgi:hypothetical protein
MHSCSSMAGIYREFWDVNGALLTSEEIEAALATGEVDPTTRVRRAGERTFTTIAAVMGAKPTLELVEETEAPVEPFALCASASKIAVAEFVEMDLPRPKADAHVFTLFEEETSSDAISIPPMALSADETLDEMLEAPHRYGVPKAFKSMALGALAVVLVVIGAVQPSADAPPAAPPVVALAAAAAPPPPETVLPPPVASQAPAVTLARAPHARPTKTVKTPK